MVGIGESGSLPFIYGTYISVILREIVEKPQKIDLSSRLIKV